MYANTRYILFSIITMHFLLISANNAKPVIKKRTERHLFPLLGYLHGFKIGQNFALQLPPFVLSPVIVIPSVNQQQSVNVQKSSSGENYQESGGIFQNISPARIVSDSSKIDHDIKGSNKRIEFQNQDEIQNSCKNQSKLSDDDSFRQAIINDTDTTTLENFEYTTSPYDETTNSELESLENGNFTEPPGPYPNALYNNTNVNTLSITVEPLQYNLTVPNFEDRWKNFTQSNNFENNDTNLNSKMESIIFYPTTESYVNKFYPYPAPWYKENVDRLSITTNSYTNEDSTFPPTYDDRWQRFSSLGKSNPSSGFRPLAGLYYDGFLHKSLTKDIGFLPYNYNGYYNNRNYKRFIKHF